MTWILAFTVAANIERFSIPALTVGTLALLFACGSFIAPSLTAATGKEWNVNAPGLTIGGLPLDPPPEVHLAGHFSFPFVPISSSLTGNNRPR